MATKLFLRETTNNGIGAYRDMVTAAGASSTTGVVNTQASGTEIQWTKTAGGAVLEWISGRVPAGGFTLAGTMTFSIWAIESNMNANAGARARVFKRTAAGSESEIGGGPWNDGIEFSPTADTEMVWTGTPTSTAFAENDRIIVRIYITNAGTMGGGFTCTITYDAADAATGDSFFQINETVTFKAEPSNNIISVPAGSLSLTGFAPVIQKTITVPVGSLSFTGFAPTVSVGSPNVTIPVPAGSLSLNGFAPTVRTERLVLVPAGTLLLNSFAPSIQLTITVPAGALSFNGFAPAVNVGPPSSGHASQMTLMGICGQ